MKTVRSTAVAALLGVLAFGGLTACDGQPMDQAKVAADPARFGFEAAVTVSPAALAKLKAADDHIVVTAHYYGMPAKGSESQANAMGQVPLGDAKASMGLDATQVKVTGEGADPTSLPHVDEGTIYVWLSTSAVSAMGVRDELIDCSHFRGTMAKAQAAPVAITCDLAKAPGAA